MRSLRKILITGFFLFLIIPAFAQPVKDGDIREYYEGGPLRAVSRYKDGQLNGVQKEYFYNQKLKQEATFENGKRIGLQKVYFENGQLEAEWTLDTESLPHGTQTVYLEDATKVYQSQYEHGRLLDDNGKPYSGQREIKYPDGKTYSLISFVDGFNEGGYKKFYPDGQLKRESKYVNDLEDGEEIQYYKSGKIEHKENYKKGELDGLSVYFFENGQMSGSYEYRDGKSNGETKEFYEDGKLRSSVVYSDDIPVGQYIEYYPDGKKESVYEYDVQGNVSGETHFNERGQVIRDGISFDIKGKQIPYLLLWYLAFLFSLTIHEASHALAGYKMGDDTAYREGQVTLNPLPHIRREFLGTVLVPLATFLYNGWMIGWASAPFDPRWAYDYPRRAALMSLAGPVSNLLVAAVCMVLMKIGLFMGVFAMPENLHSYQIVMSTYLGILPAVAVFLSILFYLNLLLFVFNLMPLPPLDGSSVVTLFMSEETARKYMGFTSQAGFMFVGLYLAWQGFGYLFRPVYRTTIHILYPGIDWGW